MPPKANTKAKVTKPAPVEKAAAAEPKKATPPSRASTRRAPEAKAKAKPAAKAAPPAPKAAARKKTTTSDKTADKPAPKKAAPKAAPAKTSTTTTKRGTKRKAEEEAPAPAAEEPARKKVAANAKKSKATIKATKSATTSKAESKAPAKATKATTTNKPRTKRKAEDEALAPATAKKARVLPRGPVINQPPTQRLNVYVFGEGTAGELGLGTPANAVDVKRPRLNPHLDAQRVGVVQISAGGMHNVALTHDNKILTWGVNDQGALGRDTTWEGGLKDIDAAENDDDDDSDDDEDNGLNPRESMPGEVDFSDASLPQGTRWTQVAAGDSASFALTDDGRVYGWGTFRGNEGIFGFDADTEVARRPKLLPELKKITSLTAGANHALALDTNGATFAWGSGQQMQLGRRVVERTKTEGLKPREFGLPKGKKNCIVSIASGAYHSFAIDKKGSVYGWGLNNFGETGLPDNAGEDGAVVAKPRIIDSLEGKNIISIKGGSHHTVAATDTGDCLVWGRADASAMGLHQDELMQLPDDVVVKKNGKPAILLVPTKVTAIKGEVVEVASSSDHNVVVTKEGKAWSWGFSGNYQTGLGVLDDVEVATLIDNTAVREQKLTGAACGGQFGILTGHA